MKVYEVVFNWSTEGENNVETAIFSTYENAKEYYDNIIENEQDPEISWVADAFDENGDLLDSYELYCSPHYKDNKEHDLWWCIWNNDRDKYFDEIYLRIKEIDAI